jgi:uncharacterized protein YggE
MHARALVIVAVSVALAAPATAEAAVTITATGTGSVKVVPKDRHSSKSIAAADAAAQKASVRPALADAKSQAQSYASAAGLTLGPLVAISDQVPSEPFFSAATEPGPFGPGKFCGTERVAISQGQVKVVDGKQVIPRQKVRFKKVHRCIVPRYATTTLAVTYSAS